VLLMLADDRRRQQREQGASKAKPTQARPSGAKQRPAKP
jgi:hypothetical protein